jgi:hypothetical protein
MGIHYGCPNWELDPITQRMDYYGPMVNKAHRISSLAGGGDIFLSETAYSVYESLSSEEKAALPHHVSFNVGLKKLKGIEELEKVWCMYPKDLVCRYFKDLFLSTLSPGADMGHLIQLKKVAVSMKKLI